MNNDSNIDNKVFKIYHINKANNNTIIIIFN